jgi:hypothetical protein
MGLRGAYDVCIHCSSALGCVIKYYSTEFYNRKSNYQVSRCNANADYNTEYCKDSKYYKYVYCIAYQQKYWKINTEPHFTRGTERIWGEGMFPFLSAPTLLNIGQFYSHGSTSILPQLRGLVAPYRHHRRSSEIEQCRSLHIQHHRFNTTRVMDEPISGCPICEWKTNSQ